ncbi:hypothetical protein [Streptomyces glaucus]|uniref:Lipoprotein n=1 Tax=Streptomyces glaucus TaxID=284029 RepID=A0ABP5WWC9_9ACTN
MAETRRRLRSSTVVLGGMGVLATALTSCGSEPDRRCVDRDSYTYGDGYRIIADRNCKSPSSSVASVGGVDAAWYYDAEVSGGYAEDGTFSRSEAVDRNGFGCSGSGSGGG